MRSAATARTTTAPRSPADDAKNREAFANYIGGTVRGLVLSHLDEMMGPVAPREDSNDAAAE